MPTAKRAAAGKASPTKRNLRTKAATKPANKANSNGKARTEPPAPPPLVYTIPEAAHALGVSDKTVRRLISDGELAARRVGSQIRILHTALLRFLGEPE